MKISVITPSFQQGQFIERTVESVLSQESVDFEYLIFDGGSTDETASILERYSDRVRWKSEKDRGQAHAVNKGILASDGEVIGWLNSDDIYYPGALAQIVGYFAAHPEIDVVYGEADHIDKKDEYIEDYPVEEWNPERLKETCIICQPALFFRRSVVERFGLLDEEKQYCMDYEYWLRLAKRGAVFHYLPVKLAGSRFYNETKTLGARVKVHKEVNDMMKQHFGRVDDGWLFNYAHAVVDNKGISRSDRRRFVWWVGIYSVWAAIRWNHRLSGNMLKIMARWIKA